jgi:hypothetical protein
MLLDDGIGHWEKLPCFLGGFLAVLGPAFVDRFPIVYVGRYIPVSAVLVLPLPCIHIISSAKQAWKLCDPLFGALRFITGGAVSAGLAGG